MGLGAFLVKALGTAGMDGGGRGWQPTAQGVGKGGSPVSVWGQMEPHQVRARTVFVGAIGCDRRRVWKAMKGLYLGLSVGL